MRIAFLNASVELGGAERLLLHLLHSLRAAAPWLDLHLIVPADGPLPIRAAGLGVRAHFVPMPPALGRAGESHLRERRWGAWWDVLHQATVTAPSASLYARRLRRTLAQLHPDVIHSNSLKSHLMARVARPARVPVVWHVHDFYGLRPVTRGLLPWSWRGVVGAVAVSRSVASDIRPLLPGRPVETVLNAIDLEEFADRVEPADLDRLAGLPPASPGTVRVGLIATYARWKGQDVFLKAAARVRPSIPMRFYVVGGPIYQTRAQWSAAELRGCANALGLAGRVGFVPFQPHAAAAFRSLDVAVHASTLPEPFGLTIAEAMACGRAVIAARTGGAAELFTDGHDAVGVPPGDDEALAGAIRRLAADVELRRQLGRNARDTAVRCFDRNRLGPQMLDAYRRFLRPQHAANASAKRR